MSSFDLFGEFKRQAKLSSLTQKVRNTRDAIRSDANKAIKDGQEKLVQGIEQAKSKYDQVYGLPTAASSEEDKEAYKTFMSNIGSQFKQERERIIGREMLDAVGRSVQVKNTLNRFQRLSKGYYSPSEISDVVASGLGDGEIHTGVLDIFNKTADARAAALGITKFRGTDEAMGTLNSARSLFYKDNTHLNDGVVVAGVLGGTLATGMAAGKVIGAGLDAAYVNRD